MAEVGKKAPNFKLQNQDGKVVKLGDFKGKKVVIFAYPRANTSGCTRQASGFRDEIRRIKKAGGIVLGISTDKPETLKKWRDKIELPYDLLSDPDHEVLEAYGAWGEKKMYGKTSYGVIRSHFIIDEKGKLVDAQLKVKPEQSVERAVAFLTK